MTSLSTQTDRQTDDQHSMTNLFTPAFLQLGEIGKNLAWLNRHKLDKKVDFLRRHELCRKIRDPDRCNVRHGEQMTSLLLSRNMRQRKSAPLVCITLHGDSATTVDVSR